MVYTPGMGGANIVHVLRLALLITGVILDSPMGSRQSKKYPCVIVAGTVEAVRITLSPGTRVAVVMSTLKLSAYGCPCTVMVADLVILPMNDPDHDAANVTVDVPSAAPVNLACVVLETADVFVSWAPDEVHE
jgi:hypothetical protein